MGNKVTYNSICSADDCVRLSYRRNMCDHHYRIVLREIRDRVPSKRKNIRAICSIDGCEKRHKGHGPPSKTHVNGVRYCKACRYKRVKDNKELKNARSL